jgi:hypothetical protein
MVSLGGCMKKKIPETIIKKCQDCHFHSREDRYVLPISRRLQICKLKREGFYLHEMKYGFPDFCLLETIEE